MKTKCIKVWLIGVLLVLETSGSNPVHGQVWTNSGSGTWNWQDASNWSGGAPSISQPTTFITNAVNALNGFRFRTVNIDATTSGGSPSTMSINYLTVSAPGSGITGSHNAVFLNNAGLVTPLHIVDTLTITSGGAVNITNSVLQVDGAGGRILSDDSILTLNTGTIITTNAATYVGNAGTGQVTISAGTWLGSSVTLGFSGGTTGTLYIEGGTVTLSSSLLMGASGVGAVFLTGGQLNETNETYVGEDNIGQVTISNGTWVAGNVYLGLIASSQGTVSIADGSSNSVPSFEIGYGTGSTGTVWLTGGRVNATNEISVGYSGIGQMTVSNGTSTANNLYVGNQFSSRGTLTLAGGTNNVLSTLQIAYESFTTGTVWMTGGQLSVTGATIVGENGVAQMTVSHGLWESGTASVGEGLGTSGTLTIAGGTNTLFSAFYIAHSTGNTGAVWLTGGLLSVTNTTSIAENGTGQMTVSNGTWTAGGVVMGRSGSSSHGTLTIAGGATTIGSSLEVGGNGAATLWLTGGQLTVGALQAGIGANGVGSGRMVVSNGTWLGEGFVVGSIGSGTLTVAGGTNTMSFAGTVGQESGGTGTVWLTGGLLDMSFQGISVGTLRGIGQMTVSNGTFLVNYVALGSALGQGTLTVAGGTNSVTAEMSLGTSDCSAMGVATVAGGSLFITNAAGNAVLDIEDGTFTLNSGLVIVDQFVMTNACAHFVRTGGTLVYGSAVLNPNGDADGDGIPNGYEQTHGLDPLNPADAGLDNDGDGFSNLQEYLAGTDPNNSASYMHITSIMSTGNNILVTWMMGPSKTNALQRTSGAVDGSYQANGFADIFTVTNTVGTVTNYVDVGGATNKPSRYYRVRLVP